MGMFIDSPPVTEQQLTYLNYRRMYIKTICILDIATTDRENMIADIITGGAPRQTIYQSNVDWLRQECPSNKIW